MKDIDLLTLNSTQGFRILGAVANDNTGNAVNTAGDINADGLHDIIIGARCVSLNGRTEAGAAYVIYGKVGGLTDIDLANLTSAQGFKILGAANGDWTGNSVSAAGDINGDGFNDVIVGAHYASPNGKTKAGSAYVIYGKSGGLTDIDLANLTSAQGFKIFGAGAEDSAGVSVSAAGDINGDGVNDAIIGAPQASPGGKTYAGIAYVIYGKTGGLTDIDLANFTLAQGFKILGAVAGDFGDRTGCSVSAAGDMNGDGLDDVIVGAFLASPSGRHVAGAAYVIYGKIGGLTDIDLANFTSAQGFKILGAIASDWTGSAVIGAGDINGNGFNDVIVGAIVASPDGRIYAGMAYVLYGNRTLTNIDLANLTSAQGFKILGAVADDQTNSVSASCDINGDGFNDIIIGAWRASPSSRYQAGIGYVIYGNGTELTDIDLANLTSTQGFRILGAVASDLTGNSVSAAGDINGDGLDDIIIGAVWASTSDRYKAGAAYVIYGNNGFSPTNNPTPAPATIVPTSTPTSFPTASPTSVPTVSSSTIYGVAVGIGIGAGLITALSLYAVHKYCRKLSLAHDQPPSYMALENPTTATTRKQHKDKNMNGPSSNEAPIGIALSDNKIDLVSLATSTTSFDYHDNGIKTKTSWVGSKDTFLIYDHNGNKQVDAAKELVLTKWSTTATTDFEALKEVFDSNQDNKFDINDAKFYEFYIWQDKNQDGVSQSDELTSLSEARLLQIDFNTERTILDEFFGAQQAMNVAVVSWADGYQTLAYDLMLESMRT